jgi:hypothetical protein
MAMSRDVVYDLAVSFASEHRDYVQQTVRSCEQLGLLVFYDKNMSNEWWGKNFIREQRTVYGSQTRYFVPFISTEYLSKPIPMDEFSSAMMTAVKQGDGYILPVLIGDVQVPADFLHPHIHYLRAEDYTPIKLAEQLQAKVAQAKSSGQSTRGIDDVVQEAMKVRLPKVVPAEFSKYQELQTVFDFLRDQFQLAVPQLHPLGFIGTVTKSDNQVSVRIETHGQTVYSLDIIKGGSWGDDKLTFAVGRHRMPGNSSNGWVTPFYDKAAGCPKLKMLNFSVLPQSETEREFTKEELFKALWSRLVEQLELLS